VDGRQPGHQEYFNLLFHELKHAGLLNVEGDVKWRRDFQKYYDFLAFEPQLLAQISKEYGSRFLNVLLINSKKYVLLCRQFGSRKHKRLLRTAVYFTLLGCILDDMLDRGSSIKKAEAAKKLGWEYGKDYFTGFAPAKSGSAIDLIFGQLAEGFRMIQRMDGERYAYIISLIQRAVEAELFAEGACAAKGVICKENKEAVMDKSVLFAVIPAEITLAGYQGLSADDRKLFTCIGHIFALVDDVCDYYEDLESGQKNIIVDQVRRSSEKEAVKQAVSSIAAQLEYLKEKADSSFYQFIWEEVKEWALSNAELREKIWTWQIS